MDKEYFINKVFIKRLASEKEYVEKKLYTAKLEYENQSKCLEAILSEKPVVWQKHPLFGRTFFARFLTMLIVSTLVIGRIIMLEARYPKMYWSRGAAFLDSLKGFAWVPYHVTGLLVSLPVAALLAFLFGLVRLPKFNKKNATTASEAELLDLEERVKCYKLAAECIDELMAE